MFRSLLGKIFPFWDNGTNTDNMQRSDDWEQAEENGDEIPAHEFLNVSNSALSDEIQSHEFLDSSDIIELPSDLDGSMEIKEHPLLTDSGEHVLLTPTYSPRSGSSVDPAGTYSVDVSNNADLDVSNNADSTASVVEPHGFVDKTSADVSGEVTEKEKIEVVVPTIEVTEVQEVEPSSDEMKHDDITAIEAANELKAANLSEAAMKKEQTPHSEKMPEKEETYLDYVHQMTANQKLIGAKDLFYQLGFQKGVERAEIERAAVQQYQLAASKHHKPWVRDARYFAEILFSGSWIDDNLPSLDEKSGKRNKPKKKKQKQYNPNEQFELPGGTCRDFRLKENPNLEMVKENAASCSTDDKQDESEPLDKFVSDYTNSVIEQAIKMAISDGLSESAIMDVIEDVTASNNSNTPRKGSKVNHLDTSRTPRRRPDQLAMGFNYHSDVVVKESPKTLHGEIIPIDMAKQPREKPDQLAVGFSYHSDVIVKESPKVVKGDTVQESSPLTPRRRARDQLAVGFSYHAKLLAKDLAVDYNENYTKTENRNQNDENNVTPEKTNVETVIPKSGKKSVSDMFAVGFSYNSDLVLKESLEELNANSDMEVKETHKEETENEDKDVHVAEPCDMIGETRVAGSVW